MTLATEYALPINPDSPPPFLDTQLVITPAGAPTWKLIYQARQIEQTLEIINAAQQQSRDVNAILIDLSNPAFRKYSTTITCPGDVRSPPFDNLWPGMVVSMASAAWLAFPEGNPGSPFQEEYHATTFTLNGTVYYQPYFPQMMVRKCSWTMKTWAASVPWSFQCEQI
jgi:hypothetical protein